eukprot:1689116-Rhodomonas_salina.1
MTYLSTAHVTYLSTAHVTYLSTAHRVTKTQISQPLYPISVPHTASQNKTDLGTTRTYFSSAETQDPALHMSCSVAGVSVGYARVSGVVSGGGKCGGSAGVRCVCGTLLNPVPSQTGHN